MDRFEGSPLFKLKLKNSHKIRQRNWQILQEKDNFPHRHNALRRTIERSARQWFVDKQKDCYLLQGQFLIDAEKFSHRSGEQLSEVALKFIDCSIAARDNVVKKQQDSSFATLCTIVSLVSLLSVSTVSLNSISINQLPETINFWH